MAGTVRGARQRLRRGGGGSRRPPHRRQGPLLSGAGTTSGVIAGIDWVTDNDVRPAVANLSLSGLARRPLDDAVKSRVARGILYSIAAGNEGADACDSSPARAGTGAANVI